MEKITRLRTKDFPDYWITTFIFLIGLIFFSFLIINGLSPIVPSYFWLKALFVDVLRIKRKQGVTMPGFVYWVYGIQFATFWMAEDILFNNPLIELGGITKMTKYNLIYNNTLLFWLIVEILTSISILPITFLRKGVSNKKSADSFLMLDVIRAVVTFLFIILLNFLLLALP